MNIPSSQGRHTYNLTQKIIAGAKATCYAWYLQQEDPGSNIKQASQLCPPSLDHVNLLLDLVWAPSKTEKDRRCFSWQFELARSKSIFHIALVRTFRKHFLVLTTPTKDNIPFI